MSALVAGLPLACPGAGTVSTATEAALNAALAGGGLVNFAFNGTITITSSKLITVETELDASGHTVILSGGTNVQLFNVSSGVSLTLRNLTLADGRTTTNGGAIYNRGDLAAFDCVFTNNLAVGSNGVDGTNGLSATGTSHAGNGSVGTAGGSVFGAAIYNAGTLALTNCVFQNNSATGGTGGSGGNGGSAPWYAGNGGAGGAGGMARGGAIYSIVNVAITNCTFVSNNVTAGNSGNGGSGGTAYYFGSNAHAGISGEGAGAGVYASNRCLVVGSTFFGNRTRGGNGGTNGLTTLGSQTDAGPTGGNGLGGGICNRGTNLIINCTFNANTATGGNGGGGSGTGNWGGGNGGNGGNGSGGGSYSASFEGVTNCTFSGCVVIGGRGGPGGPTPSGPGSTGATGSQRGANIASGGGVFALLNCILADPRGFVTVIATTNSTPVSTNSPPENDCGETPCTLVTNRFPEGCTTDCTSTNVVYYSNYTTYQTNAIAVGNAYGTFTDAGHNLSSDNTPTLAGTSHNSFDAKLGLLADNGGPTKTMLLLAGSPAINAGDANLFPEIDQRGDERPSGTRCDIGAVEMDAPVIQSPPQSTIAVVGADVQFSVSATSEVSLNYQWRFNGTNMPGQTSDVLVISPAQKSDAGNYQVVITNYLGSVTSQVAELRVGFPPALTILRSPLSETVLTNTRVVFTATATGDTPLTYQWRWNGTDIAGATGTNYVIASAQTNHTGTYDVVVTNDFGSATSDPLSLNVGTPPSIQSSPQSLTVVESNTANFSVTAAGTPPLNFQWRFQGGNLSGATGSSYMIPTAQTSDAGNYDVVISSDFGSVTSQVAHLTVNVPPRITSQPQGLTIAAGANVSFTVSATGTLPLSYQWYFNSATPLAGATSASFAINNVSASNAGDYTVVVSNLAGTVTSAPATLRVLLPLAIESPAADLTSFWFAFRSQSNIEYVVEYKNALEDSGWTALSTNVGTGDYLYVTNANAVAEQASRFYRLLAR